MSSAINLLTEQTGSHGHEAGRDVSDRQLLDRFVADGDESAFVCLVRRYSNNVWGVCRRMLRQEQDAEDAFQAVFMILARKADSIRKGEAVGSWLYGVAYRTAMKARQLTSRRSERDKKALVTLRDESPASEAAWRELQRQVDEELQNLAEKYKAPFVLCCLEGMSRADAARELGLKEGTVSSRLAHARKLLQARLTRRGVVLSAALTALALSQNSASAAASAALVNAAVLTTHSEAIPCSAAALADNVLRTMGLAKLKAMIGAVVLATALTGTTLFAGITALSQAEPKAKGAGAVVETFVPPPFSIHKAIDEQILALAFSPDGKKLVTAGARHANPGQIKVWDVASGAELARVRGIVGARSVAVSPDGNTIVTGHFGGSIVRRDAATGKEQASVHVNTSGVNGLAFSREGDRLASAGLDRTVKILDAKTLDELQTLRGHSDMVYSVAFFRHGKGVVSGGNDKQAIIWDLGARDVKHFLKGHRGPIETVAISPDDKYVATASWDKTMKIWDAQTGADKGTFVGSKADLLAVDFSPNGAFLATGARDGAVCLWEVKSRTLLRVLGKHQGAVWAVAFSHDGNFVASGSSDKTAKLWHTSGKKDAVVFQASEMRPVQALVYASSGKEIAVAGDDKVRLINPQSGELLLTLNGHAGKVNCVAYAPDGLTLATGSDDMTVKIWDRQIGKEKFTLKGHAGPVNAIAFTPDGKKLASAGDDKVIKIWTPASGAELAALNAPAATVRALAFTADGNVLASGSDDGAVLLSYFDNHTEPISLQAHDGFVRALAFSGSRLASAGDDGKVKIWTAAPGAIWKPSEGKQPLVCQAQPGSILALAFTPNGGSVVSGGRNGMITVWDASTGRVRGLLPGHKGAVKALAIHPHGENLISGGADAALLRWRSAGAKESSPDFPANAEGPIQVGQTPPPDGPTGQPEGDGARIPQGGRGWLVAVALISLIAVLVVAGGLGVGLYVRKNKKANKARASTKEKQGDESSSRILLQCPKCDRKLKVKFALAGKHVKCMCGAAVPVPAAKTPSTAP